MSAVYENNMNNTKKSDKLIINELLTFLQNKIDVLDELTAVQICSTHFSEDDVEAAKDILCSETVGRRIMRKGEGKKCKNLYDIIKILKETENEALPTFVAQNLHKLPPVNFDHIDVTCLLKDIMGLKGELTTIQSQMSKQSDLEVLRSEMALLRKELKTNNHNHVRNQDVNTSPSLNTSKVTIPIALEKNSSIPSSPLNELQFDGAHCNNVIIQHTPPLLHTPKPWNTIAASNSHAQQELLQVQNPEVAQNVRTQYDKNTYKPVTMNSNTEGFKTVTRKPRRSRNITGTATDNSLKIAELKTTLYVSRFDNSVTENNIRNFVDSKITGNTIQVEKIIQRNPTQFGSFKLTIPNKDFKTYMNKEFWPAGTVFRKFIEKKYNGKEQNQDNLDKLQKF